MNSVQNMSARALLTSMCFTLASATYARSVERNSQWLDVGSRSNFKVSMPSISSSEVLSYSQTAWGSPYVLGGSKWDSANHSWGGPDCAGLVLKSWGWPTRESSRTTMSPSYRIDGTQVPGKLHTSQFNYNAFPWAVLSSYTYGDVDVGDAFTYYRGGATGHTFLIYQKVSSSKGSFLTSEARSRAMGVGSFTRLLADIKATGYRLNKPSFVKGKTASKPASAETPVRKPAAPLVYFHTVNRGDSLDSLSRRYAVPKSHIMTLNPSVNWSLTLKFGSKIRIL